MWLGHPWTSCLLAVTLWTSCGAAAPRSAPQAPEPAPATVQQLLANPAALAGRPIVVSGKLVGEGNYFSRRSKLFLVDDADRRIEVTPWLPRSIPPRQDDSRPAPPTQADFLDQRVQLTGVLRVGRAADAAAPTLTLEVTTAKIVRP